MEQTSAADRQFEEPAQASDAQALRGKSLYDEYNNVLHDFDLLLTDDLVPRAVPKVCRV